MQTKVDKSVEAVAKAIIHRLNNTEARGCTVEMGEMYKSLPELARRLRVEAIVKSSLCKAKRERFAKLCNHWDSELHRGV